MNNGSWRLQAGAASGDETTRDHYRRWCQRRPARLSVVAAGPPGVSGDTDRAASRNRARTGLPHRQSRPSAQRPRRQYERLAGRPRSFLALAVGAGYLPLYRSLLFRSPPRLRRLHRQPDQATGFTRRRQRRWFEDTDRRMRPGPRNRRWRGGRAGERRRTRRRRSRFGNGARRPENSGRLLRRSLGAAFGRWNQERRFGADPRHRAHHGRLCAVAAARRPQRTHHRHIAPRADAESASPCAAAAHRRVAGSVRRQRQPVAALAARSRRRQSRARR